MVALNTTFKKREEKSTRSQRKKMGEGSLLMSDSLVVRRQRIKYIDLRHWIMYVYNTGGEMDVGT